jgi:hypothetical protein
MAVEVVCEPEKTHQKNMSAQKPKNIALNIKNKNLQLNKITTTVKLVTPKPLKSYSNLTKLPNLT